MAEINGKVLLALLKDHSNRKTKVAEINGELGERLLHHKEASNLHLGAFRLIAKLYRDADDKRKDFIAAFELYRDIIEESGGWPGEHAGDLADMAGERQEVDEDAAAAERNADALQKGITELTPEDGPKPKGRKPKGGDAPGTYRVN